MPATVTLHSTLVNTRKGTTKLTVEAESDTMSPAVFAIEVLPRSTDEQAPICRFSHVCSPSDMSELPVENPGDGRYLRISEMTMVFDIEELATTVLSHIREDVKRLVDELNRLDEPTDEEIVTESEDVF